MQLRIQDLTSHFDNWYTANHQVVRLIGDESYSYQNALQKMCEAKQEKGERVIAMMHDRVSGFYDSMPRVRPPETSSLPLNAMVMMMHNEAEIKKILPVLKDAKNPRQFGNRAPSAGEIVLPFDPQDNIIFMLKDWEGELLTNPSLVQAFRNVIQSNACSDAMYRNEFNDTVSRGRRMLVLVTPTDRWPQGLPEVKPITVSLPDTVILTEAVTGILDAVEAKYKETKGAKGLKGFTKEERLQIVTKLHGATYQFAEDAVSLMVANEKTVDMPKFLNTLEEQMSTYISGIPGLEFIPKSKLTPVSELPGYEPAVDFVRECMSISDEECQKRKIQKLRGITLAGAPGTGKTRFGMAVAAEADRMLLLWNIGESQGSLVGDSEANTRRVIQIAQASRAVVLLDDVDKAGVSVATGGSTASIEGGPFGRMIQMLLTEMSSPENQAIWVFTCNRITNLPPELIRPGRMDERFFVKRPDERTRELQIRVHIEKRGYTITAKDASMIRQLALDDFTDGWAPAEIEDLVKRGVRRASRLKSDSLDYTYLTKLAKDTTPMIKQDAYSTDITKMEEFCRTWTKCGHVEADDKTAVRGASRSARNVG